MRSALVGAAFISVISVTSSFAGTVNLTVDAKDDIFLAGQSGVPSGFPANSGTGGEGAGMLPVSIWVHDGEVLTIGATGTVSCCLGGTPTNGPDGGGLGGSTSITGYGNVGAYSSGTQMALVGVFGGPTLGTPWTVFQVGHSAMITVGPGETQLFLGIADAVGFGSAPGYYNDNTGAFKVSVSGVPEASTWLMLVAGFAGLGFVAQRRSARNAKIASFTA